MARVTKINVGGTHYDIAHEGELKNSGFEVVSALPTTGLFEGRQVVYQNRVWVYSNGWVSPNNPVSLPTGVTLRSSTEELTAAARYVELGNFQLEQIPELLNKALFISNNDNGVKKSDRLYELIDNETGTITIKSDIVNPVLGQTFRYTAINPSYELYELYYRIRLNGNMFYKAYCIYIPQNVRYEKAVYKIEYYIYTDATGDGDINNRDNYVWKTVFEKELRQYTEIIYPFSGILSYIIDDKYRYTYNIRVSITPTTKNNAYNIDIKDIDIKYFGINHQSLINANRFINYNAVIEPSQTGETFKSIPWILQYLTQGVNWLKAKNVRLSAYNTKIAALEQADSDNNASTQSVRTDLTELSNGLAAVARSGSYNDLTDKPTFSGSYNDLTDKPTLATVATSGSYNDLTDKPTFSGSYNDLTDKPTLFSGSYNDLTDKPTLFSGSYDDLTDKPTLAAVATSGSYNDLTDNPTQLPNPNPIIIKTADGVSVRYDGSTSGGVTLEAGNNAELTATQDSDDTMTVKFGAIVPQTLPNPNALNIMVLDSEGALLGPSIVYDGVATKYIELIEGYGIKLSNSNLSTGQAITINLKQIAGTTLLGNANDTIGIPQAVTMTQLRTMLGSLTLNDIDVTLGGNNSYTLPCYIDYNGVDYPARIRDHWLQIYRNGVWANLYYLLSSLPTECRYITDLSDPSWYDESITEYELDNSATTQLLRADSSTNIANWIEAINANQITFNSSVIASKDFNKGALDNIISNLKGKGYSVFVENDIDTILNSGNDWVISIKIKRFNNLYKAIIECYVAR